MRPSSPSAKPLRRLCRCVCLLLFAALPASSVTAQNPYYPSEGSAVKLNAQISIKRASISGLCALRLSDGTLSGVVFNEFGISVLGFRLKEGAKRAKIVDGLRQLRRPIVRRIVGRDLARCIECLQRGDTTYINTRQDIRYEFSSLPSEPTNDTQE